MRKESALRQAEAAETKSAVTESRANKRVAERGSYPKSWICEG